MLSQMFLLPQAIIFAKMRVSLFPVSRQKASPSLKHIEVPCEGIPSYTSLHYTTLHYTTLHYTTLHYTTLHYTTTKRLTLLERLTKNPKRMAAILAFDGVKLKIRGQVEDLKDPLWLKQEGRTIRGSLEETEGYRGLRAPELNWMRIEAKRKEIEGKA